jgi:hypothetical protein
MHKYPGVLKADSLLVEDQNEGAAHRYDAEWLV